MRIALMADTHLWMPSSAFILPDDMQTRIGEKLVGIGLLDLSAGAARFELWCPDGMRRHDVSTLGFFRPKAETSAAVQVTWSSTVSVCRRTNSLLQDRTGPASPRRATRNVRRRTESQSSSDYIAR